MTHFSKMQYLLMQAFFKSIDACRMTQILSSHILSNDGGSTILFLNPGPLVSCYPSACLGMVQKVSLSNLPILECLHFILCRKRIHTTKNMANYLNMLTTLCISVQPSLSFLQIWHPKLSSSQIYKHDYCHRV